MGPPHGDGAVAYTRLPNVVQNEDLIWMTIDKGDRLGEMVLKDEDVVSQSKCAESGDASIEVFSKDEVRIRFVMDGMAYAFELGQHCELLQFGLDGRGCQGRPANDSQYQVIAGRHGGEPPRFLYGALHLNDDSSRDPGRHRSLPG